MGIGFVLSVHLIVKDAVKNGYDQNTMTFLLFAGFLAGITGTRILHIIMYRHDYSLTEPLEWIALWKGGLVFQGAIPAVIVFFIVTTKRYGIPFWTFMDFITPHLQITHIFGRLGCFCYGCCHGIPTTMPWGIRFPKGSPAYVDHASRFSEFRPDVESWSYPVHPTQLYEATALLILWFLLLKIRDRFGLGRGLTLPSYLMLYGGWRFFNEFFRNDNPRVLNNALSEQQVICIFFVLTGAILFAVLYHRRQRDISVSPKPHAARRPKAKVA